MRGPVVSAPGSRTPLVRLKGITKTYGTLRANDGIDLKIGQGEIHALLGENGAGKSTLVKILYGVVPPSEGEIVFEGRPVAIDSPVTARRLGIGMVFQHFSLFEELTVAENVAVALGDEWTLPRVRARLGEISAGYGLALAPDRKVWTLSVGERQRIEIVRCLLQDPKLIILDEPTSVLTPQEADRLFETLRRLAGEGHSILFITHRLEEVRALCDRATILRAGKVVASIDPRAATAREIAAMMVGSEIGEVVPRKDAGKGEPVLVLNNLSTRPHDLHEQALRGINLTVHSGEVLGIAGVAGSGQAELFAQLSGERSTGDPQAVHILGHSVGGVGIDRRRRLGAAFVPEERLGHATVPRHRLSENAFLSHRATGSLSSRGFVRGGALRRLADTIVSAFDVRVPRPDPEARRLSGGNLQKFVVGREMLREPRLLVVDQPTWGVDAGAARLIRQELVDLARGGAAVLVISQDLDELFEISDRIAVMHAGRLSEARPRGAWTREAVGLAMAGAEEGAADAA